MPSPPEQVTAVLEGAGVAHWTSPAQFAVSGRDAAELLSRLSSQSLDPLDLGRAVTTLFLSPTGRTLHRVLLQPLGEGLRALAESAPGGTLAEWIERYTFTEDCHLAALPEHDALLLLGRRAAELAAAIGHGGLETGGDGSRREELLLSRRDFGPIPAIVVTGPRQEVEDCAAEIEEAGALVMDAAGLLQLRVEAGVPAAGSELTEEYHPLEAGLREDVSFDKGCYTGQEVVARQDSYDKVVRRLVGLVFAGLPEPGEGLESERKRGCVVTSVAPAPPRGRSEGPACLGYVHVRHAEEDASVRTESGLEGRVVALPFPRLR